MSTGIEELVGAEVERSFDSEPPLRDPREHVARGRRARRRRRTGMAGAGLAAAAVVTVVTLGGSQLTAGADRGVEPAGGSHAVRMPTPVPVDPRTAARCSAGSLGICGQPGIQSDDVHLDGRGRVVRGYASVHVTGYYDHVLTDAYRTSAALEVAADGETVWILLTATHDGSESGFQSGVPDPDRTFDEWVRDSVESGRWFSYSPDPDGPGEGATPQ